MENNRLIEKYTYSVEWSEEDRLHIARCLDRGKAAQRGPFPRSRRG